MPLRAIIRGEDILAPFLDNEAWERLKNRVKQDNLTVTMPCCGNPAYLRTSKHGFHHFVHKVTDNCTSKPETWQHLKAKHEIVLACRAAGYDATTEVAGDTWRADVLATKGNVKVAFEVQWSPQTWEVTQQRQKQYSAVGIRGCWFFKTPPRQYEANMDVPLFKLAVSEHDCSVIFNPHAYDKWHESYNRSLGISDFVQALLNSKIKFCDTLRSLPRQKIRIIFLDIECWKCHKPYNAYYMDELKSGCGHTVYAENSSWGDDKYYLSPQIVAIARDYVETPEGRHLRLSTVKMRYSKTVGHAYRSFGCPYCDAILGDFYLHHEIIPEVAYQEDRAPAVLEHEVILSKLLSEEYAHWCFPENGQFCCGK